MSGLRGPRAFFKIASRRFSQPWQMSQAKNSSWDLCVCRCSGISNSPSFIAFSKTFDAGSIAAFILADHSRPEAVLDLIEARFEIEDGFTKVIEDLLQKLESGEAAATETEQFRRLADEVLRNWDAESWLPKFKERIEAALRALPASGY